MTPMQIRNLLGRDLHAPDSAKQYDGKTVLITGGGGSIGRALGSVLSSRSDATVILMDRSETALMRANRELPACKLALADVTRFHRIRDVMRQYQPDAVFHAAAHKHVPFMEGHIEEAYDNNYVGTVNAVRAAQETDVSAFTLISTDKAVEPSSVMGATKYMAERYVLSHATRVGATLLAVRFGNVLGSSGSLLEIWSDQVRNGEPLSVTHHQMTRYLMTLDEAAGLVLGASSIAQSGELFVLNMGKPVSIVHLARRFNSMHDRDEDNFVVIGLRPGEKLTEKLHGDDESLVPTDLPHVFHVGSYVHTQREREKETRNERE